MVRIPHYEMSIVMKYLSLPSMVMNIYFGVYETGVADDTDNFMHLTPTFWIRILTLPLNFWTKNKENFITLLACEPF